MEPSQMLFVAILLVAFVLLLTEWLRNDVVAVLVIISLTATGVLEPKEALAGFSSEPAIVVAGIFVLSAALHQTGLAEVVGTWISRLAGTGFTRSIAVLMPSVAVLSAFTHHLTTTAMMLPVVLDLARTRSISPSKLLMPLAFAASLGTTITIIGAPAFILASGVLQQAGRPGLGVFSIAPIGLALSVAGTLFILLVGRFLLPDRGSGESSSEHFRLEEYFTELTILPDSPFLGRTVGDVESDDRYHFRPVGLIRDQRHLGRELATETLLEGDVLLVRTTPDEILAFRQDTGVELNPVVQYGDSATENSESDDVADSLVQAVVAPGSELARRSIGDIDFRRRYGAIVVGLWRRDAFLDQELSQTELREGDVLVLQGDEEGLARVAADPAILTMMPFQGETRLRRKAPLAGAIMLGSIVAAAFNLLTVEIAVVAGAVAMVLTHCLTLRQAYRSIDARMYVFIAGAIPLGTAMKSTGTLDLVATWLQAAIGGWSQLMILAAIFAVVAILTQFMSDAATTALFGPVAVALAQALGHAPEAYVVTVAMAAVASFLTPIGHHGNLLIYGPGRYHFADFVRVGAPLTVVVGVVVCILALVMWPV